MATVTIDYFGVEGSGKNVTEAKRDAGAKIQQLVKHCHPRMYSRRGEHVVIYPDPHGGGWYSLLHADGDGETISSSSCVSFRDAEESGVRHLLSNVRAIGDFDVPAWARRIIRDVPALIRDWKDNDAFQRAYRHAETLRVDEMDGMDPHRWACTYRDRFRDATVAVA